ncbi:MAG: hypothetical protein DGJ47_000444 [Rickettsiaceae bacterium]
MIDNVDAQMAGDDFDNQNLDTNVQVPADFFSVSGKEEKDDNLYHDADKSLYAVMGASLGLIITKLNITTLLEDPLIYNGVCRPQYTAERVEDYNVNYVIICIMGTILGLALGLGVKWMYDFINSSGDEEEKSIS